MSTDYYLLDELLTDDARDVRDRVRAVVDSDVLPVINDYWDRAEFPWPLVPPDTAPVPVPVPDRTAATRRDHAQPAIIAGQRPRSDFWHLTTPGALSVRA